MRKLFLAIAVLAIALSAPARAQSNFPVRSSKITITTTSPLGGGGAASSSYTLTCATCVVTGGSTMTGALVLANIAGALVIPPAASMTSSSLGVTNTTGIVINPNVADGASTSGVDVKNSTATTSAALMRFLRSTGTASAQIELDTILPGSMVLRQSNQAYLAMLDSQNNGIKITGGISTLRAGGGDIASLDGTSWYPATDGAIALGKSSFRWKRDYVAGNANVAGDYALSAGWGTTASVGTLAVDDDGGTFVVTASGTGQAANPTITLTFHDGTWTNAPNCMTKLEAISSGALTTAITEATTATTMVVTFNGTPAAAATHTFRFLCRGR